MKQWILLGVLFALVTSPVSADQVYWDLRPPADPVITEKDFMMKFNNTAPVEPRGEREIYDSGRTTVRIDPIPEESAGSRRTGSAIQPDAIDSSRSLDRLTEPSDSSRPSPSISPRPLDTNIGRTRPPVNSRLNDRSKTEPSDRAKEGESTHSSPSVVNSLQGTTVEKKKDIMSPREIYPREKGSETPVPVPATTTGENSAPPVKKMMWGQVENKLAPTPPEQSRSQFQWGEHK